MESRTSSVLSRNSGPESCLTISAYDEWIAAGIFSTSQSPTGNVDGLTSTTDEPLLGR